MPQKHKIKTKVRVTKFSVKKTFSLIEVLISFFLACMITMFLIGTYVHFVKIKASLRERSFIAMQKERSYQLLSNIFSCLTPLEKESSAYLEKNSLVLHHKNLIDIDPIFCGNLTSKIYLEQEKLFINTNPLNNNPPRKILLLEGLKSVDFNFYDASYKKWVKEQPKESQAKICFVKFTIIDKKENQTTFIFNIPNSYLEF